MSFGFSIGDLVTLIDLANKIRKQFVGAPSQLQKISDEYVRRIGIFVFNVSADKLPESEVCRSSFRMSKSSQRNATLPNGRR